MDKIKAHTQEEFNTFMSQLLETNANLGFYTDFAKCHANVNKIAMRLNALNYLIGKDDIAAAVHDLWEENPQVFTTLDILILLSGKSKQKALYLFIHRYCSRFYSSRGLVFSFKL